MRPCDEDVRSRSRSRSCTRIAQRADQVTAPLALLFDGRFPVRGGRSVWP